MRNRAICKKCNTVIESKYNHDWVKCNCEEEYCFVDGGNFYRRYGYHDLNTFFLLDDQDNEIPWRTKGGSSNET